MLFRKFIIVTDMVFYEIMIYIKRLYGRKFDLLILFKLN